MVALDKLTQSFVGDRAAKRSVEAFGFNPKSLGKRQPKSFGHGFLVGSKGRLRQARDELAKLDGAFERTALRHNLADQANPMRFLGVDDPTGDDHFHGSSEADDSRETLRSTIRETDVPAPASDAKRCVLFRNSDICKARPFEAAGIGDAIHRSDDRLVDIGPSAWTERARPFAAVVGCNLGWRQLRAIAHRFEI